MAGESRLSICLVSHSSALGGAERSLLDLVTQLVNDCGATCYVVVPGDGPLIQALQRAGASCVVASYGWWCAGPEINPTDDERSTSIQQSINSIVGDVLPQIRQLDPDVIWTQTLVIPWGALIASALSKPHVWSVREFGERDHDLQFFWPFRQIIADIVASSAFIFTASKAVSGALFPALPPARVEALYGSVTLPPLNGPPDALEIFSRDDSIKLGVFANFLPSKGQEDALQATATLLARSRNVELLLAGLGGSAYQKEIAARADKLNISDRICFSGLLADPYPAMRACDIIVVCSRSEGFGRVVVEGMLLEKPVVYAAAGGMLETMIDGETGLAYTPGDIGRLVEQLEQLIASPERRRELGKRGRVYAARRFGRDGYGGKVFRKLLELRSAPAAQTVIPSVLVPSLIGALGKLKDDLDDSIKTRDSLQALLMSRAAELAELSRAAASRAHWQARFDGIVNSTSWRVTAPLRAVRTGMSRLFRSGR